MTSKPKGLGPAQVTGRLMSPQARVELKHNLTLQLEKLIFQFKKFPQAAIACFCKFEDS